MQVQLPEGFTSCGLMSIKDLGYFTAISIEPSIGCGLMSIKDLGY